MATEKNPTKPNGNGEPKRNGNGNGAPKRNGGDGNGEKIRTSFADAAPLPSLHELLTKRLAGVGKRTAEEALAEADLDGEKKATRVQANRANAAPTEKAGLRGKALATWVLTGKSDGGKRPPAEPEQPARRRSGIDEKVLAEAFVDYLNAQVSGDADAPLKGLPTVDENGRLRVKSAHWREWLASRGITVGAGAAVKPLRAAGLDQERWFSLPRGQRMTYAGPVPSGTKRLPVRKDTPVEGATAPGERRTRGGKPFARPSVEQADLLVAALKAYKPNGAGAGAQRQLRDELLSHLVKS